MALAVPLSRFTPRVGGGSAFFVRPHRAFGYYEPCFVAESELVRRLEMSKLSAVSLVLARAGSSSEQVRQLVDL